jgi:hypothetical protein
MSNFEVAASSPFIPLLVEERVVLGGKGKPLETVRWVLALGITALKRGVNASDATILEGFSTAFLQRCHPAGIVREGIAYRLACSESFQSLNPVGFGYFEEAQTSRFAWGKTGLESHEPGRGF